MGCTNHGDAAEALRVCDFLVTVFLLPFACPGRQWFIWAWLARVPRLMAGSLRGL